MPEASVDQVELRRGRLGCFAVDGTIGNGELVRTMGEDCWSLRDAANPGKWGDVTASAGSSIVDPLLPFFVAATSSTSKT